MMVGGVSPKAAPPSFYVSSKTWLRTYILSNVIKMYSDT